MWFLTVWGEVINQVFGSLSHKLNLCWKYGNACNCQSITRLCCWSSRLIHPSMDSNYRFATKPPGEQDKGLFSVSLPAFASIYILAGFFPKEITSCEAGFDSHHPPPTLLFHFRNYWIALYSRETPHKCHMFIHGHTPSILQAWWQTDKAKPHIFELTWMLLPLVAHREWVTASASRRTSAMETSKTASFSFPS